METSPFVVDRIRGIDERWKPAGPATVLRMRDFTWDPQDVWVDAGGSRLICNTVEGVNPYDSKGKITSIHNFSQRTGGKQWLIYETSLGLLRAFDGSHARSGTPWLNLVYRDGTTVTDRAYLSAPWPGTASATWGDRLYLVNGINKPVVFDGDTVDVAGWDAVPPAPQANANDGVGNLTLFAGCDVPKYGISQGIGPFDTTSDADDGVPFTCAYRYKVSFVNERGQESPLSEASSTVTFVNKNGAAYYGSGSKVVQVTIPIGPSQTVMRRVYRTNNLLDSSGNFVLGRGEQFFYLCSIEDNEIAAFEDGADDSLTTSLVNEAGLGLWPAGARYLAPFAGTMFVAGLSTTSIYYSAPGYPEVFPPDNILSIGDAHLGPITGMFPTRDALVVFKQRGIYLVKLDANNNFYVVTLSREYGCAAPKTIVDVPNVGLCFVGGTDIFALTGTLESDNRATVVQRLSTPIPQQMARINRSALLNACATVYHRDKEVWFVLPTLGGQDNRIVLVYHYEVGAWSTREDFTIGCMLTTADSRGYIIYGSYDDVNTPGIYVYSRGWDDKAGTAIAPLMQTANLDGGKGGFRTSAPRDFMLRCGGMGNNTIGFNYGFNRKPLNTLTAAESTAMAKQAQLPQSPFAVYGVATYTTNGLTISADNTYSVWSPVRAITQRFPISQWVGGPILDLTVTVQPSDRHIILAGFSLEEAPIKGKPIDTASGSESR